MILSPIAYSPSRRLCSSATFAPPSTKSRPLSRLCTTSPPSASTPSFGSPPSLLCQFSSASLFIIFPCYLRCNDACQPFARFAASHAPTAPPVTRRHSFVLTQALRHSTSPTRYGRIRAYFVMQMHHATSSRFCLQLLSSFCLSKTLIVSR
jgi:hypothetical protein